MENKIKEYRKETNMTQQQLANTVSVSSRTIISLEKGQYNPSILLAYKIACVFNTTIEELYYLNKYSKENINENI
ncbi:helix-turn-helix transcriptional regulator [Clostridium estertheticum]|uniref:Transcriptional regulator n=1 Tax=Clostridium estertheticum subsp. estertheticum TaxID=1552 RepID=A0A1J0GEB2_9CLOT|nr:helix-turn-helix transcriptional regulator [Clostridium estertheticum]APC39246.1 transcriptional regulator [Clostridium estertheticum subsp. estertheticum]MBU3171174.1 helix-turn-helix transcriptional regulator [Clostridium estertheticum]MBZ9614757.1 helix-turn-helix transcriptional regulator [Clostridium estertheticum subsp. laramiense]WAG74676.1 helix-turn-helix transcriptional regulator [Clostridium estertheticum]